MIKLKVTPVFPSSVVGAKFITVQKVAGNWTLDVDYSVLGEVPIVDPTTLKFPVLNTIDGSYNLVSLSAVVSAASNEETVTAAGDITIGLTETYIRLNKTVPAASNIVLPASATRNGLELIVKDVAGNAATYNFTFVPFGSETIDGLSSYVGTMNFQTIRLKPRTGGWDVLHSG
jgi:hypothetical protein